MSAVRYLLVQAGGQPLAVPVSQILRIHDDLMVEPLPGTQAWFLGLAVAQGRLLPVTDLGRLLFGCPVLKSCTGKTLQIVSSLESVGFRVDSVNGFGKTVVEDADPSRQWPVGVCAHQCCVDQGTRYRLLDVAALISSEPFCSIADGTLAALS